MTNPEIYKVDYQIHAEDQRLGEATIYVREIGETEAISVARQVVEESHLWDDRIHGKRLVLVDVSELPEGVYAVPEGETIHGIAAPDHDATPAP